MSILATLIPLMMKASLFISLVFLTLFGCTSDPDLTKIAELESLVNTEEIFGGEPDWSIKKRELSNIVKLYERIDNKHLISDETFKGISIYYLYTGKGKLTKSMLDQYLEKHPQDGEALFYRGLVALLEKQEYCEDFRKAAELGYKPHPAALFSWDIRMDEYECQ